MSATVVRRNIDVLDQWQPFAQTIKAARLASGYPMRKFARLVDISLPYLTFIETAKCPPPSDAVLLKMAEHLDLPAHTLFAMAGRLPPDVTSAFWQHPAIPPILSTIPGMNLSDAQLFCAQVGRLLPSA